MATTQIEFTGAAIAQLDRMFASHSKELRELAASMSRQTGGMGSTGMPGIRNTGGTGRKGLLDAQEELEKFVMILKSNVSTLSASEKYRLQAARREIDAIKEKIKVTVDETEADRENARATREAADAQDKHAKKLEGTSKELHNFAEKVISGGLQFTAMTRAINEFSQAYKQGFNWNAIGDSFKAAIDMGMSPKDMMDFQKRFRRVSNTFDGGIDEFNTTISKSNVEWLHYTGSLKDAANAQAEFADLALSMGIGSKDVKSAVGGMFQEFKKLQVATSMTAEEFVATQKSLLAEKIVRDKLIGLQGRERTNYMLKLTDTAYMFQTLGLQKEAAESLVKALENQANKGAVGRLREGAQIQAVAGIVGMGGQDAQTFNQLYSKRNRSKEEDLQLVGLAKDLTTRIETKKNSGTFNEAQMNALEKTFGPALETIASLGGDAALANGSAASPIALQKQQLDLATRDSDTYGVIKENIVRIANIMDGWSQSALAALIAAAFAKYGLGLVSRIVGGVNPGPGGGPPGGGPPPGPGAWAKFGAGAATMLKTGTIAAVIGVAASAAVEKITDNKQTQGIANSAITGAALGATIGSVVPIVGTAMGAVLGGVGGLMVGIVNNQETVEDSLAKQKQNLISQADMDEMRFRKAKESYESEIKTLELKAVMSKDELARYDLLKGKMDAADKEHSATQGAVAAGQIGYQINSQGAVKDWMSQSAADIKNGGMFSQTSQADVKANLAALRGKLSAAGVSMSDEELNAKFGSAIQRVAAEKTGIENKEGFNASYAIGTGNGTYDAKVANPIMAEAMRQMIPELIGQMSEKTQAEFSTKMQNPAAILAMQNSVHDAAAQMAQDKADLAASANMPGDDMGIAAGQRADLQKRIDQNQALLDGIQQLATNSQDKTVKFASEEVLVDTLKKLVDTLDKNPIKKVKP